MQPAETRSLLLLGMPARLDRLSHGVAKLFTRAEHYSISRDNRHLANCAAFLVVSNAHHLARSKDS
jgi:hypothetical protein